MRIRSRDIALDEKDVKLDAKLIERLEVSDKKLDIIAKILYALPENEKPVKYEFEIVRDKNEFIKKVIAIAIYRKH